MCGPRCSFGQACTYGCLVVLAAGQRRHSSQVFRSNHVVQIQFIPTHRFANTIGFSRSANSFQVIPEPFRFSRFKHDDFDLHGPANVLTGKPCPFSNFVEAWRSEDEEPIELVGDQVIWPQGLGVQRLLAILRTVAGAFEPVRNGVHQNHPEKGMH